MFYCSKLIFSFKKFDMVLSVIYSYCITCSSLEIVLKSGISNLRHEIPTIVKIVKQKHKESI